MGYSREVYDAAVAELEKRRIEAVNRAAALKDRMTAKYPRVREIETAMASCSVRWLGRYWMAVTWTRPWNGSNGTIWLYRRSWPRC